MQASTSNSFNPLLFSDTKFLILGTFPSLQSFENNFYYGHPRNQFWKIMASLFKTELQTNEEKIDFCKNNKIGLWDICANVKRAQGNSSDSNLKEIVPNDIASILNQFPQIEHLFFTGKKAESLYKKHFQSLLIKTTLLPSPSPAYASISFDQKKHFMKPCFYAFLTKIS